MKEKSITTLSKMSIGIVTTPRTRADPSERDRGASRLPRDPRSAPFEHLHPPLIRGIIRARRKPTFPRPLLAAWPLDATAAALVAAVVEANTMQTAAPAAVTPEAAAGHSAERAASRPVTAARVALVAALAAAHRAGPGYRPGEGGCRP